MNEEPGSIMKISGKMAISPSKAISISMNLNTHCPDEGPFIKH